MNDARRLTADDLARALAGAAMRPAVDRAVRARAEAVARTVGAEAGGGVVTRVLRREAGDYVVSVEGQGLFARAFGSVDKPGDPAIAEALAGMKR